MTGMVQKVKKITGFHVERIVPDDTLICIISQKTGHERIRTVMYRLCSHPSFIASFVEDCF